MSHHDSTAANFEWFADWASDVSPLYHRLATGVTNDDALLSIASEASEGQPPPNMLFAAVHSLLLNGATHELATFYPTCTDAPASPTESDPFPAFREFCLANEARIRDLVRTRRVQTNAVGRSSVLFPAFKYIVEHLADAPLSLIEVGASAGLNLYWDRYQYEYRGAGTYGREDSPVVIDSAVRGDKSPPLGAPSPEIEQRLGIDINPLDVADPADARWLRALVIPDQQHRFERLDAAISLASDDPPPVRRGDALSVLPDVLATMPEQGDVCVFSTLTLYQFEDDDIARLRSLLADAASTRRVFWLSNDPTADLDQPVYRLITFDGSNEEERKLLEYKAHGEWIRWLQPGG